MALIGGAENVRVLVGAGRGRLCLWERESNDWIVFDPCVPGSRIDAVTAVKDHFLIASGGRLFELRETLVEIPSPVEGLRGICFDESTDRLFLIGAHEVFLKQGAGEAELWAEYAIDLPLGNLNGFASTVGPEGGIYVGNLGGVFSFDRDGMCTLLDTSSGLIGVGICAFLHDREGNVWVGSQRGLSKIISRRFSNYDRSDGLLQSEVSAVLETLDGTIVLGHPDGLTFLEDEPRHLAFGDGLGDARVLDLDQSSDGRLWAAATWFGLVEVSTEGDVTVHGPESGLALPVNSVFLGEDGPKWVATGRGMFRSTEDGFESLPELSPGQPSGFHYRDITQGEDGRFYCGTSRHGLVSWGEELVPTLLSLEGEPGSLSCYTIEPNGDGEAWVGSAAGLMRMEAGHMTRCQQPQISRPIYFVEVGSNGTMWFGTNNGVYHWNGDALRHFGVNRGLSGSETNRAAGFLDSRGQFWIGTNDGVSVYKEGFDVKRSHLPTVEILSCDTTDPEALVDGRETTLAHEQNRLTFHYRAIAFTDEARVQFQTRLSGLEEGWSDPHTSPMRQTSFRSLVPGSYTFHIRAIDVEGQVSAEDKWETIHIREPYWNENWFRILAALVLVGLLTTGVTLLSQYRNAGRLEREVALRTQELSASQALTERERAQLELTLANITDGVATIGLDGKVLLWNHAAHRVTGWSADEAIGRPLTELLGDQALIPIVNGSSAREVTMRTGEIRQLDIASAETAPVAGAAAGRVVVFRDVTQKLALDRELVREDKLEALGLLAGGIAHDFNNLLTVIIGNLSLPLPTALSEGDFAESIQDANSAAERARLLTLQLLTFSKGGEPVRQTASVADLLEETSSLMFSGANVLCEIDATKDLRLVDFDAGQMGQVFHNLMLNAREAMPNGGVLHIRASNVDDVPAFLTEGEYILVEFEDEGVGVSPDDLKHIFDPYFSTKSRGSGLGLAIAYSVVQRHGGHVTVDSAVGQGTIFRIYLKASDKSIPDPATEENLVEPKRHSRILVMDDEEAILRVVTNMLDKAGYQVAQARDGQSAIEQYQLAMQEGVRFDAVLMDLTIPGAMGGKDAVKKLLQLDPTVCAIVASGYSNDPVMARAKDFGFSGEISKPFGAVQLIETIERALERGPKSRVEPS